MPVTLQPAFILHRRSYRETSLIVELFTCEYGRISAVARGIRKARSRTAALLQPFIPLVVSWYGKGEMVSLSQMETKQYLPALPGKNLRCGFYLNELLMRLLPKHDPHPQLFTFYQHTLEQMATDASSEKVLRLFEKKLLEEIGYGLPLKNEMQFKDQLSYQFDAERGFLACGENAVAEGEQRLSAGIFSGKTLNALLKENFEDSASLQEIKRLMRFVLAPLLGRPLESRRLFERYIEVEENV